MKASEALKQGTLGLRDYYEHTWKARARLLDAAESLTPAEWTREFDFSWRSMQKLFGHIIQVERGWMTEDVQRKPYTPPTEAEIGLMYATPASTRARGDEVAQETRAVLAEYVPSRLHETRESKGADGKTIVTLTIEEILTHVFTHELRHQGQLQATLRLLSKEAPNVDWY